MNYTSSHCHCLRISELFEWRIIFRVFDVSSIYHPPTQWTRRHFAFTHLSPLWAFFFARLPSLFYPEHTFGLCFLFGRFLRIIVVGWSESVNNGSPNRSDKFGSCCVTVFWAWRLFSTNLLFVGRMSVLGPSFRIFHGPMDRRLNIRDVNFPNLFIFWLNEAYL